MYKMYLENGNAIKTDWEGSIALSAIPTAGIDLPYPLTIESYELASGDFAGDTLSITPVVFANTYWVIKNTAGTIDTTHLFESFTAHGAGDYRIHFEKSALGVVTLTIFYGKDGNTVAYSSVQNEANIVFTLNDSVANSTTFDGYIEFRNNVICIGDEVELVLGADDRARCFQTAATFLYTHPDNEVRFYVKEFGFYTNLDETDADTMEVSKTNTVCDVLLKKEIDISGISRSPLDLSTTINLFNSHPQKIKAGNVVNKPLWVKTLAGMNIMYNEIQSWL